MLDNKLGIDSSAELAREEERITKKKAIELFEHYACCHCIRTANVRVVETFNLIG